VLFVLFGYVLTQYTPLPLTTTGTPVKGSLLGGGSVIYSIYQNQQRFELNWWRTNTFIYGSAPSIRFTLKDASGFTYSSFNGQGSYSPTYIGNYTFTVTNHGFQTVNYEVRACSSFCPSACPFSSSSGYCYGNGACTFNTKLCTCDNTTTTATKLDTLTCNYILDLGLWTQLLGLWIFLIILGFFLVCILPIICCCCCGVCVAAAATERRPVVTHHHHHNPNETTPVYVTSPNPAVVYPAPGVQYVQAQPVGLQPVPQPGLYPNINPQGQYNRV